MKSLHFAAAVGALSIFACAASAQTINSSDRGWYTQLGFHEPLNDNYIVGVANNPNIGALAGLPVEFRNFFVFDIPALGVGQNYTAALLSLYSPGITDPGLTNLLAMPETFSIQLFEGDITTLLDGSGTTAAFNDLGDGTVFGTATISDNSIQNVTVNLNAAGLAAVNARNGQKIVLGGTLSNFSNVENGNAYAFGFTGTGNPSDGRTTLNLQTTGGTNGGGTTGGDPVPEPGEWAAMGILGAGLAGLVLRKRRNG